MVEATIGAWLCGWIDKLTRRRAKPAPKTKLTYEDLIAALTLANQRTLAGNPTSLLQVLCEWDMR